MLRKSKNEKRHIYYSEMIPMMVYQKKEVNQHCPVYILRLRRIVHKLSVWRGTKDFSDKTRQQIIDRRWMKLNSLLRRLERKGA